MYPVCKKKNSHLGGFCLFFLFLNTYYLHATGSLQMFHQTFGCVVRILYFSNQNPSSMKRVLL